MRLHSILRWLYGIGAFTFGSCLAALLICTGARAADMPLIDLTKAVDQNRISVSTPGQVSVARTNEATGIDVTCHPGADNYPGIAIKPEGALWDLSAYGHVDAKITNTSVVKISVCLRVDNDGDWQKNPWNAEVLWLQPGATGTVRVRFGYSWGQPGYALKSAQVNRILLFAGKADSEQSFTVTSVTAGGTPDEKPPVAPDQQRTKPKNGVMLGQGSAIDGSKQLVKRNAQVDVIAANGAQSLRITMPADMKDASVMLIPQEGRWNLRDWLQVTIRVRNAGTVPATISAHLESNGGSTDIITAKAPLAPGAVQDVVVPFASATIWNGDAKSGSQFTNDTVYAVAISAAGDGERVLVVDSITAGMPTQTLPAWLGKRPPVPGDWKLTMDDEFDGHAVNTAYWSYYGENYWDKQSHFSKENTILDDGVAKLRFEKKRGHINDDLARPETDWTTGFLTGYGKWTQRYGYFEARMKLPKAPGLWLAFWMMPDRGPTAGGRRDTTENDGMEFDIMESLTRFGPNRYNIAMHWDGYGANHKSTGTERIYIQPDKDGFIVAGLLWEPGRLTFYANGTAVARWENPRIMTVPGYMMFTLPCGGWGGNVLTGEGLPDDFVIDYVRVWQRSDLAQ
ncbi:MAG TPA: glycoside hydrolase family 16 protein [Armatimonadota bacterium]|nr:glycoside hydrolase family 16 protein [Armatimonadota bacterium]